nr:zona pellucida sperm-binding protein 3 [Nothobranchius furzeri]
MARNLPRIVFYWTLAFYSVSTLTEDRLTDSRSSGAANLQTRLRMRGEVPQPRLSATIHQESSVEHGGHTRAVLVKCHPDSMEVVVQADLFETGLEVDGGHLRLGSDSPGQGTQCGAFQSGEGEFTILVGLTECGTKLSSTEEKIIYSNVLIHSPELSPAGLFRLDEAAIPVECHYEKRYSVDGISLLPAWIPYITTASEENQIDFDIRIMNDDWQHERGSHLFFLGDVINFEVSVVNSNHIPLRVYVDHCVATATPDMDAELRYDFIEHNGCLADAYLTNSNSLFLPRVENKLRFQLNAFRFYQEPNDQVFITCFVKAVPVTSEVNSQNRACSFIGQRWLSVDGSNQVCRSCDISQRFEEPQATEPPKVTQTWPTMTSQGSLVPNKAQHPLATYFHVRPGSKNSQFGRPQQPSKLRKRKADSKEQKTVLLRPLTVLPSRSTKRLKRKGMLSQKTWNI